MASEPMTLGEFEREAKSIHLRAATPRQFREEMRTLILRLLADERARIIATLPGGDICDPQEIADMIRTMGDQTAPAEIIGERGMSARDVIAGCLKQLRRPGARTTDAGDAAFVTAALAAAGYVVERGWQPIESAPPMEPVLVFGGEVRYPVTASWTGVLDEPWALDALQDIGQEIDPPSHWRPLPDPPAAEAEAKGAVE
ncbi:MAG: DUF551 domain-containing protein [Gemmatimonadaceae bacterium]